MKKGIQLIALILVTVQLFAQKRNKIELKMEEGEYWWGGLSSVGYTTPYDAQSKVAYDLLGRQQGEPGTAVVAFEQRKIYLERSTHQVCH